MCFNTMALRPWREFTCSGKWSWRRLVAMTAVKVYVTCLDFIKLVHCDNLLNIKCIFEMLGFRSQLSWPSQTNSCLLKGRCKRTGGQGPIRSKCWLLTVLISSSVNISSYTASPTFLTVFWVNAIQFWSDNGSFCAGQPIDWLTACLIWPTEWLTDQMTVCPSVWLIDWMTTWVNWLTDCLSSFTDCLQWLIVCHGPNDFLDFPSG